MNATIKKYKGNWLLSDNNGGWIGFTTHDEAVIEAYNNGATDFKIQYSNAVGRSFTRESIENFVLKVA